MYAEAGVSDVASASYVLLEAAQPDLYSVLNLNYSVAGWGKVFQFQLISQVVGRKVQRFILQPSKSWFSGSRKPIWKRHTEDKIPYFAHDPFLVEGRDRHNELYQTKIRRNMKDAVPESR